MDGAVEDGALGHTIMVAREAVGSMAVVGDSAAAFGAVAHEDENERQALADTAVSISDDSIVANDVVVEGDDEGEGATDCVRDEPAAASEISAQSGLITTAYSVASAADGVVAAQGDETVTIGDDMAETGTNVASSPESDEETMVNVELLAARNPEAPSREQIGDPDIAVDIPSQELREETESAPAVPPTVQVSAIIISNVGVLTRNVNAMECEPQYVSIGPYYWTSQHDLARDDEKEIYLAAILRSPQNPGATEQDCLDALASLEDEARRCYAKQFSVESRVFLRHMLLDGCYLLHRFGNMGAIPRRNGSPEASGHQVQRGGRSSTVLLSGGSNKLEDVAVVRDGLFLAENQIPFFIIEKIHELTSSGGDTSAADTIAGYVRELLEMYNYSVTAPLLAEPSQPGNLLHLVHMHLKPSVLSSVVGTNRAVPTGERVGRWRSATDYHLAGVKFKCQPVGTGADEAHCILDVRLSRGSGVLEIPRLNVHAETWPLLRNLMVLEQQNPAVGSHVTAYCVFMSQLASTERDVELLCMEGRVLQHGISNNAKVAALFSDLCSGIVFDPNNPDDKYLRGYCQKPRWMAWLEHTYFRNPCLAIGLFAVTVGIFCAIVQTVYSVLSYYPHGGH
ncbi:unnamed protein product [Urochloa decumbens]|uniref:Uncharacterized protein n=1 Tax=Urochloa decumbens TaxID=240449 RepID=A0ABC9BD66_9POAL